jgi:type I restriction enzyme R subunit
MVVCVDKLTAVRMYERVRACWNEALAKVESRIPTATHPEEREMLEAKRQFMRETDMAVVISQAQNEIEFFRNKGVDILPHRQRMVNEALDEKFKKPEDPLRLVFVCAMWMTGFDAPACSTIYLDKPMRNHTLMQTIARANRVFRDKRDGLIVDYIGVFRNLEKALAIYGTGAGGTATEGEMPVQQKSERVAELRDRIGEAVQFCDGLAIDLEAILSAEGFQRMQLKQEAVEALLSNQETTQHFFTLVRDVNRLFKSILPDRVASEFYITRKLLNVLAEAVMTEIPDADISDIASEVAELLDESVIAETYIIEASPTDASRRVDLSLIDFDALRERFEQGYKHTATEKLRGSINQKLQRLVRENRTRMNYLEAFQQMLNAYNAGAVNVDVMFERLMAFVGELEAEEKRAIGENLTQEELAIFDLLTRPDVTLSDKELESVKRVAQELLHTLKQEKLVLDWRKHQHTRAAVQHVISVFLDEYLPDKYDLDLYEQKCLTLYQHVYESYFGAGRSIYSAA